MRTLCLLFLVLINYSLYSQQFNFSKGFGSTSFSLDEKYDLKEKDGYLFSVGEFVGTSDFDPDNDTLFLSSQNGNIFMSKFDLCGNLIWANNFGAGSIVNVQSFDLDDSSNIYVVGQFRSTGDFDPSSQVFNLTASVSSNQANRDIFIAKYDSSGDLRWAKRIGGFGYDTGEGIVLDDSSNIYITGSFDNTMDFDPDLNTTFFLSPPTSNTKSAYIAKYDRNGNFKWAKKRNGRRDLILKDFEMHYNKAINSIVLTYVFIGQQICLYDSNGNLTWNYLINSNSNAYYHGIESDNEGSIYFCGKYLGTVDFDPGFSNFNMTTVTVNWDIFVSKIDSSGNFVFAKSMGGTSYDVAYSIFLDHNRNIYTTGWFWTTADFDPGPLNRPLTSTNNRIAFISKLDSLGNYVSAYAMGGTEDTQGHGIVLDRYDNIHLIGTYNGTTDFDPRPSVFNMTSVGSRDNSFILRLGKIYPKISVTVCHEYKSPSGKLFTNSGLYHDTLSNSLGGDSIIEINLKVKKIDTSINKYQATLTLGERNATKYQWYECMKDSIILGNDTNVFTPNENGFYAAIIEKNNCFDTTRCIPILGLGINDVSNEKKTYRIYPNPAKNSFFINIDDPDLMNKEILILDYANKIVYQDKISIKKIKINTTNLKAGLYIIRIGMNTDKIVVIK